MKRHPKMSIVIPTYNGANVIGRALESLLAQNYPRDRFEVIVVDDGSTDNTAEVVKQYPVKYVKHPHNRGIAAGRNSGLAATTGDIYIGFDDDGVADPNWLSYLATAYATPDVAGIGSILDHPHNLRGVTDRYMAATGSGNPPPITMNASNSLLARLKSYVVSQVKPHRFSGDKLIPVSRIFGATASFPVDVLRAVGGWDETMSGHKFGGVEDTDLCHRILEAFPGRGFYAYPPAVLVHDPKMSFKALIRRSYVRGPQNLAYYSQNKLIPPIFPGPVGWVAAVLLSLMAGPAVAAMVALLIPLALYFWWPVRGLLERRPDYLANAYVQLSEEAAATAGLGLGYWQLLRDAFNHRPQLKDAYKRGLELFRTDSLFRNATFLMASTAIMSVLGFVFWIFVAHLYSPAQIGAASALISITLLISNLSFLGLNSGFLRFLPSSAKQSRDINAGLLTVAAATVVAASIYLAFGNDFSGSLGFFTAHLWSRALFVLLMVAVSLNTLTDSVFIANRRAGFHTMVYTTFGVLRLALPLILIPLGSLGIFAAYIAAAVVSLILSLVFMWRGTGYRLLETPNWHFIRSVRRYTSTNYVSTILAGLPSQILPSLIIGALGSAQAAFFSMAWTMANILYVIPSALTNSLMAESSHDFTLHARNLKHAARTLALILMPGVLAAIIVAPFLLRLFGPQYAAGSTAIFQLLAISALSIAINSVGSAVMNLEHRTEGVLILQSVIAATTLGLSWFLIRWGLIGVGLAMLGGNLAGNLVSWYYMATSKRLKPAESDETVLSSRVVVQLLAHYQLDGATYEHIPGTAGSTVAVFHKRQKYVLKIYQGSEQTAGHLDREIKFTNYLTAQNMPVPRTVPTVTGHSFARIRSLEREWFGVLMHFEQGHHPDTYSRHLLRDMARVQARIHVAGAYYAGDNTTDAKLLTGRTLKSRLLSFAPKGLGHFDFDGTNLLANDGRVSCVLDFEGVRYDPLVVCVIFTLSRLYDDQHNAGELGEYLDSYQTVRPLNFQEKIAIRAALTLKFKTPGLLMLRF